MGYLAPFSPVTPYLKGYGDSKPPAGHPIKHAKFIMFVTPFVPPVMSV